MWFFRLFPWLTRILPFHVTIKKGENIFGYSSNFSNLGIRRWLWLGYHPLLLIVFQRFWLVAMLWLMWRSCVRNTHRHPKAKN
jgi:hypothetical protein